MKEIHHSPKKESIIGETSHVIGKLQFKTALRIKGKFDGEILEGGDLIIEKSSTVKANMNLNKLDLHGSLIGDANAKQQVKISEDASIMGNLNTKSISIAQGAKLKGSVNMLTNSDSIDIFSAKPEQLKKLVLKP